MLKTRVYDSDMSRRKSYILAIQGRLSVLFYVNYNDYVLLEINKHINYISSFRYVMIITESYEDILNGISEIIYELSSYYSESRNSIRHMSGNLTSDWLGNNRKRSVEAFNSWILRWRKFRNSEQYEDMEHHTIWNSYL